MATISFKIKKQSKNKKPTCLEWLFSEMREMETTLQRKLLNLFEVLFNLKIPVRDPYSNNKYSVDVQN